MSEKYIKKILDTEYVRENPYTVNWKKISKIENLPLDFIREFKDRLNWKKLNCSHLVNDSYFLEEFGDRVKWSEGMLTSLSEDNADRYLTTSADIYMYTLYNNVSTEFARKHAGDIAWVNYSDRCSIEIDFLDEFKDHISWTIMTNRLIRQELLSEDIVHRFHKYLNWHILLKNLNIPEDILRQYAPFLDWSYVSEWQPLSAQFMKDFQDQLYWSSILANEEIPLETKLLFTDKLPALKSVAQDPNSGIIKKKETEVIDDGV